MDRMKSTPCIIIRNKWILIDDEMPSSADDWLVAQDIQGDRGSGLWDHVFSRHDSYRRDTNRSTGMDGLFLSMGSLATRCPEPCGATSLGFLGYRKGWEYRQFPELHKRNASLFLLPAVRNGIHSLIEYKLGMWTMSVASIVGKDFWNVKLSTVQWRSYLCYVLTSKKSWKMIRRKSMVLR